MAAIRKIIDILAMPIGSIYGFLPVNPKESLAYIRDGVRVHTLPIDHKSKENAKTHCKWAEFVDIFGNITDEFWSDINDFDYWFIGKVARGEQFFVIFHNHNRPNGETVRVITHGAYVDGLHGAVGRTLHFAQADDMTWHII